MALRAFCYGRSCVSLRLFMRLGTHLANWPCIAFGWPSCQLALPCVAFGRPSCELALRCVRLPNLGEAVLKTLPPSQNWFLSVIRLVFLPSAPLRGSFRYGSSCFSLRPFVRFFMARWVPKCTKSLALRLGAPLANSPCLTFGEAPRAFRYGFSCVWAPILRTRLALRLGAQPW
jgi:hypothetical protein